MYRKTNQFSTQIAKQDLATRFLKPSLARISRKWGRRWMHGCAKNLHRSYRCMGTQTG